MQNSRALFSLAVRLKVNLQMWVILNNPYLDLTLSHSQWVGEACSFRPGQVFRLFEGFFQRKNLLSWKSWSGVFLLPVFVQHYICVSWKRQNVLSRISTLSKFCLVNSEALILVSNINTEWTGVGVIGYLIEQHKIKPTPNRDFSSIHVPCYLLLTNMPYNFLQRKFHIMLLLCVEKLRKQ